MIKRLFPNQQNIPSINYEKLRVMIEDNKENVVLDFSAKWCGPCKKLTPVLEKIAGKYTNIYFYKFDIDKDVDDVKDIYNISSLPSVLYFNNGQNLLNLRNEGLVDGFNNIIKSLSKLISLVDNRNEHDVKDEIEQLLKNS